MLTYNVKKRGVSAWPRKHPGIVMPHSQHAQVRQILHSPTVQSKLTIGTPNDQYEQEADRVAHAVMRMQGSDREQHLMPRERLGGVDHLRRQPLEEEDILQTKKAKSDRHPETASNLVGDIAAITKDGRPLSMSERTFFEPRMGCNFDAVRLHTDVGAQRSARRLQARAYTVGSDIVFGRGEYAPHTKRGRELIAHELTHVMQQSAGLSRRVSMQAEDEPAVFPDFPKLLTRLNEDVRENVFNNAHHFFRVHTLHPDRPDLLEDTFLRFALGANVLSTAFQFANISPETSDILAPLTGVVMKGVTFVTSGELVLDYQLNLADGLTLEANLDLAVNPENLLEVKSVNAGLGLVGRF